MIRFIKINSSRFMSTNSRFSLIKYHDYYQILMNSKIPSWNYKFASVECAENFLNTHDYVKATSTHMPMSSDDIEFILDMYGFDNIGHNKWMSNNGEDSYILSVQPDGSSIKIAEKKKGKFFKDRHIFNDAIDAIDYLDSINANIQIKAYTSLDEFRTAITAAGRPSARDIMKNMVRVKSSNLWSYCIEIKDRHDSTGTLYIQFKGKNGGPSGGLYCYYDFPITLWRKFITAPSSGHFFWKYIRNNFKYSKLDGNKRGVLPNAIN